jgi:plasmid stabilization system protein ParE
MRLPVVLTAEAQVDFDTAADWYEQQAGIGARFTLRVREALARIGRMPELHAVVRRDIRRAKVENFPYRIFYRVRPERVEVIAVLHGRRDPSVWKGRA